MVREKHKSLKLLSYQLYFYKDGITNILSFLVHWDPVNLQTTIFIKSGQHFIESKGVKIITKFKLQAEANDQIVCDTESK